MGPKSAALVAVVDEAAALLHAVGAEHWAAWLDKSAARIRTADFRGVTHLLGAFGGMGSLNDLVISPANGHAVAEADELEVNRRLEDLLGRAYAQARELYRDQMSDRE